MKSAWCIRRCVLPVCILKKVNREWRTLHALSMSSARLLQDLAVSELKYSYIDRAIIELLQAVALCRCNKYTSLCQHVCNFIYMIFTESVRIASSPVQQIISRGFCAQLTVMNLPEFRLMLRRCHWTCNTGFPVPGTLNKYFPYLFIYSLQEAAMT